MSDEKTKSVILNNLEMLNQAKAIVRGVVSTWNREGRFDLFALDKADEFLERARMTFAEMGALLEHKPERKIERPRGVPEDAEFDVVITAALDGRVIEERVGKDGEVFESFGHDPDDAEKIGRDMIKGARFARLATKLDDDPGAG